MKDGYQVIDMDTHVNPSMEVLEKYVDPGFRPRLAALKPISCAQAASPRWDSTDFGWHYRSAHSLRPLSGRGPT